MRFKLRTRESIFGSRLGETSWGLLDARALVESVSWDSSLWEGSRFLVLLRRDQLGSTKCAARLLKELCLSLLRSKNLKLRKVIKSFVPEPISCFSGFPVYISHIRVLVVFLDLNVTLEQCPTCLVCLIWMVLEMGRRWPYSCCFVGCCSQDLFNIARTILVQLSSRFFSIRFHVVHPYSRMDTNDAWKKSRFILSYRSDFHNTNNHH